MLSDVHVYKAFEEGDLELVEESHVNEGFESIEEVGGTSVEIANEKEDVEHRPTWSNQCEFFLATLGYTVGLGNIWRFPYLAFKYGGGSFLIPYTIMLMLVGLPVFFMELALGQFTTLGPTLVFGRMAPLFKGLGFAMIVASTYLSMYYNMIIAWSIFYMFDGFRAVLPWTNCKQVASRLGKTLADLT